MKKLSTFFLIQVTLLPLTLQSGGPCSPTIVKNTPQEESDLVLWKGIQASRMPNLPRCNHQQIDQAADDVVKAIGQRNFKTYVLNRVITDLSGYIYRIAADEAEPTHPKMEDWIAIASKARDAADLKFYELFRKTIDERRVHERQPIIWAMGDQMPENLAKIVAAYWDDEGDKLRRPQ